MKAPKTGGGNSDNGQWERTISRYLTAHKVPVRWDAAKQKFVGLYGYFIKRVAPMRRGESLSEVTWSRMPLYMREMRDEMNHILIVTNRRYGDDVEDSLVVMRLNTFAEMLSTHINSDRERYIDAPYSHR